MPDTSNPDPRENIVGSLEKILVGFSPESRANYSYIGKGWQKILQTFVDEVPLSWRPRVVIHQVKEKFGGMRLYFGLDAEDLPPVEYESMFVRMTDLRRQAEDASYKTCEQCGDTGTSVETKGDWWLKTLCGGCRDVTNRFMATGCSTSRQESTSVN